MKLILLVVQRLTREPAEVLSCVDENTLDENPSWWTKEVLRFKKEFGDEAEKWAEVEIEIDDSEIERCLNPKIDRDHVRVEN